MKNYLKNRRSYLAGPIEHSTDFYNWREPVKNYLSTKLGIKVFDPADDPKQDTRAELVKAKQNHDFETVTKIVKNFIKMDLSIIDLNHFLIAYLPYKVCTTGTCHEIVNAVNSKKPVMIMCPEGIAKIADWVFGLVNYKMMFDKWENLYTYLHEVDEGRHKDNIKWYFIYNYAGIDNT